jgi:hypothetical protein
MKFYNRIGIDNYCNKSFFEKIDLLLNNNVFYVREDEWNLFIANLKESEGNVNSGFLEDDDCIATLSYLRINEDITTEITNVVIGHLKESKGRFLDFELTEEYKAALLTVVDTAHKEEIIKSYLTKASKLIMDTFYDYGSFFGFKEDFSNSDLYEKIDFYYNELLNSIDFYHSSSDEMPEWLVDHYFKLKKDVISHVAPGGVANLNPRTYETACGFIFLHELIDTLEFFKKELRKLNHKIATIRGANNSIDSIGNVLNNKNRFPLVFKNAYSCELFLFTLSFYLEPKEIIFSYHFEIFKNQGFLIKNIKKLDFLKFINGVYGLNERRIWKNLSTKKYNYYVNQLKKREEEFASATPINKGF